MTFGPLTGSGPELTVSAMIDDCPMTEECPGYDRDRQACLIHPGDCEFSPGRGQQERVVVRL